MMASSYDEAYARLTKARASRDVAAITIADVLSAGGQNVEALLNHYRVAKQEVIAALEELDDLDAIEAAQAALAAPKK